MGHNVSSVSVDFTGSRWKTVDYLTGLMALINTESSILRARCTTESQSSGTGLPAQKCLSAMQRRELKRTEIGTIFKVSLRAVKCLRSEGIVEYKYFIEKTRHVVNDFQSRFAVLSRLDSLN